MTTPARIYDIAVTVAPGTLPANPQVTPWVTEDNDVPEIEIEIPPGHNGLTGIRVMKGDVQLLPYGVNTFLIANDYSRVFPVGEFLPTSDVKIQTYNQGTYPHTFYLRMTILNHEVTAQVPPAGTVSALSFTETPAVTDPLSPNGLIGDNVATALTNGTLTAADLEPVTPEDVTVPPPDTTGP